MLVKACFVFLAIAVYQVSAKYVEPDFVENVRERESSSANRIVSGWEAVAGQYPHHAALRMVSVIGGVGGCGGSFVHREWVISAAHCTANRVTVVVRGGVVNLIDPEYMYETTQWWNYPSYNDNDPITVQPNDICIIKLQRPVVYTHNLKAIRVQPLADAFRNYHGEVVIASGHGRTWSEGSTTDILRWVYLVAISNPLCQQTFGPTIVNNNALCAGFFNVTSQSTCSGDSGGPLMYVGDDGIPTLIGVASFVAGGQWGCHSGLPAGFIRPGPFQAWFRDVSDIDFDNLNEDEETTEPSPPEDDSDEGSGDDDSSSGGDGGSGDDSGNGDDSGSGDDNGNGDDSGNGDGGGNGDGNGNGNDSGNGDDSNDGDDSSSEDGGSNGDGSGGEDDDSNNGVGNDKEISQLLKRMKINVKVKVAVNKYNIKKQVLKKKHKKPKKHKKKH